MLPVAYRSVFAYIRHNAYRRKHEEHINSFSHYVAPIVDDGIEYNIHFVALFSDKPDAVPLVLLHGWPGQYYILRLRPLCIG